MINNQTIVIKESKNTRDKYEDGSVSGLEKKYTGDCFFTLQLFSRWDYYRSCDSISDVLLLVWKAKFQVVVVFLRGRLVSSSTISLPCTWNWEEHLWFVDGNQWMLLKLDEFLAYLESLRLRSGKALVFVVEQTNCTTIFPWTFLPPIQLQGDVHILRRLM